MWSGVHVIAIKYSYMLNKSILYSIVKNVQGLARGNIVIHYTYPETLIIHSYQLRPRSLIVSLIYIYMSNGINLLSKSVNMII